MQWQGTWEKELVLIAVSLCLNIFSVLYLVPFECVYVVGKPYVWSFMGNSVIQARKNRITAMCLFVLTHWPLSKLVLGRLCLAFVTLSSVIQLCLTAISWTCPSWGSMMAQSPWLRDMSLHKHQAMMDREAWGAAVNGVAELDRTQWLNNWIFSLFCVRVRGFPGGLAVKNPPALWETWDQSLYWEDSLEKGMATHSSILAWRIP